MAVYLIPEEEKAKYPKADILDVEEGKELYSEANAKAIEIFGENSRAYKMLKNRIDLENIRGSQFFWNLWLNKFFPKGKRVISLEDAEAINDRDEDFFKDFYTDTPEIILLTEILSYKDNKHILEYIVNQTKNAKFDFNSENPLKISGLELIKDENSENYYGLLLKFGENTKLVHDKRFAYSNNGKKISFGKKQKQIFTKKNNLSRVYLYRFVILYAGNDYLANSGDSGRVVFMSNAFGVMN